MPFSRPRPLCPKPPSSNWSATSAHVLVHTRAGAQLPPHSARPVDVAGPDRRGEAVLRYIGKPYRIAFGLEDLEGRDRPEHLLLNDRARRVVHLEQRGMVEGRIWFAEAAPHEDGRVVRGCADQR